MKMLVLATLLGSAACASGPSLETAISVHNTARHIVLAADAAYAPIYAEAYRGADIAHADDEQAFKALMAPFDAVYEALQKAKLLEQALHLAVDQWQQGLDDGTMTREAAACAGDGLTALASHAAEIPGVGAYIYAGAQTLAFQLEQLARGVECGVKP
jgi:hypothetical protein